MELPDRIRYLKEVFLQEHGFYPELLYLGIKEQKEAKKLWFEYNDQRIIKFDGMKIIYTKNETELRVCYGS